MQSHATVTRLYTVCGFYVKPLMASRLIGEAGGLAACAGVAGLSPEQAADCPLHHHDDIAHERKMWKSKRIARLITCLPFVRAVALCNSLAFQMTHDASDIDLFVITAAGRVWSARWWVTGILALLRQRAREARRDPVCVSFFVDERVTDLSHLALERDVYFFYWQRTLTPLVGTHPLFAGGARMAPEFRLRSAWPARVRCILELGARLLPESVVRRQQEHIMPAAIAARAAESDTAVVLNDTIIKLHENDRRAELRDRVFNV